MKPSLTSVLRWTVIAGLVVGYPVLAHYSTMPDVARGMPMLGVATSLAPALGLLLWLAWHAERKLPALAGSTLLLGLIWSQRNLLAQHFEWIYLIQHAGTNALMAYAFGITLAARKQPLCTRFAQAVRGNLTPEVERYTRQLTLAWALFFLAISAVSVLLFVFAPIKAWSIFANFLTLPLALLMFAIEYPIRLRKLPDERKHNFIKSITAYWRTPHDSEAPAVQTLPLLTHPTPDSVVAYREGRAVTVREFLCEVEQVAARLPAGRHVLNMCVDRYRFTVGLAASIVTGRVSLLPSTHTPEMVRQMRLAAPDVFCITDQADSGIDLPTFHFPEPGELAGDPAVPLIPRNQLIARVFTSGSTGQPVPHEKFWGSLVHSTRAEGERLGIAAGHSLVGTVPAQHMYGLESTVLIALQNQAALHAARPFYPADICAALAGLPRPRALITTPFHLRALLKSGMAVPAVDLLLSATAPLATELAREAEEKLAAPLHEIYGCTETGQLASRRTTAGPDWQLLSGVRLYQEAGATWAIGGHVEIKTRLSDAIELAEGDRFRLFGRHGDLINIAGKRTSLGYLNHQLNAIPGVKDGVFLPPKDEKDAGVSRLTALVVAPNLTPDELMRHLRERIDPIFLPRPLLFVDALPRNATGKLPSNVTQELLASLMSQECAPA